MRMSIRQLNGNWVRQVDLPDRAPVWLEDQKMVGSVAQGADDQATAHQTRTFENVVALRHDRAPASLRWCCKRYRYQPAPWRSQIGDRVTHRSLDFVRQR